MAEHARLDAAYRRLILNPASGIEAARRGSYHELTVFSNVWADDEDLTVAPDLALDIFLHHLRPEAIPSSIADPFNSDPSNRAFSSMLGIGKIGSFLDKDPNLVRRLVDAWPAIYQWSMFIYSSRVVALPTTDERRVQCANIIAITWYTLNHRDPLREAMIDTPGSVEIATKIWLEVDASPNPAMRGAPIGTCALGNLLKLASEKELNRVIDGSGGKTDKICKLAITRLQRMVDASVSDPPHLVMHTDFVNSLSRVVDHPIRKGLLKLGCVKLVTAGLTKSSIMLNVAKDNNYLNPMISSFGYLLNYLDSTDGRPWILQTINGGFLSAFCDCSPHFTKVPPDDIRLFNLIIEKVLPRYLVYRSVIEAVDAAIIKISQAQRTRVAGSLVKNGWKVFYDLFKERSMTLEYSLAVKGSHLTCDNAKCQKIGTREQVRKCSGCLTTYYCSKECQTIAWKEGGHKTMCKLKQRERIENKHQSKRDNAFFHNLSVYEARKNFSTLVRMAEEEYPNFSHHDLIVTLDFTKIPTEVGLTLLDIYNTANTLGTANAQARNVTLIEKVRANRVEYALIESRIRSGWTDQCCLTLATGSFWHGDVTEDIQEMMANLGWGDSVGRDGRLIEGGDGHGDGSESEPEESSEID